MHIPELFVGSTEEQAADTLEALYTHNSAKVFELHLMSRNRSFYMV